MKETENECLAKETKGFCLNLVKLIVTETTGNEALNLKAELNFLKNIQ